MILAVLSIAIALSCLATAARNAAKQESVEKQLIEAPEFQRDFLHQYRQSPASGLLAQLASACGFATANHVTELDFRNVDSINYYPPEELQFYSQFASVHTVRINDLFVTDQIRDALQQFPKLEKVVITRLVYNEPNSLDWFSDLDSDSIVELTKNSISGVEVVLD